MSDASDAEPQVNATEPTPNAPKRRGPAPGTKKPYHIPTEEVLERLQTMPLTKKQLKHLRGVPVDKPKREMTEAQKAALERAHAGLKRWQAERQAKKEAETVSTVPLLSQNTKRHYKKATLAPAPAAQVPPSEPVSEESDSDPEVTETELSTTDAEAAGLGPARRRVTRPTKAAVKQLAVVNRALGSRAPTAPAPAPPQAPPPSPWASMLNTVWRPR